MIHNSAFPKKRQPAVKAIVVIPGLGAGGAERCFVTLAKHFLGVKIVAFIVRNRDSASPELVSEAKATGAEVVFPLGSTADDFARAINHWAERSHIALTWGLADLAALRRDADIPFIDICHTASEWDGLKPVMAGTAEGANFLAAVSASAAGSYPVEVQGQVTVIHNGIEAERAAPRAGRDRVRSAWRLSPDQKVALYVGRFSREKRPEMLLDLPDDWILVAAGPESEGKDSFAAAARQRRPGRTAFVPFSTHVGDLMVMADRLIMPSVTEAHPLTMFEAFYAKLPVICCDFPFLRESWRSPPDDHLAFRDLVTTIPIDFQPADLLAALNDDPPNVDLAHDVTCEHFLAGSMAARYEHFIAKCLSRWVSFAIDPPLIYNGEPEL